jgi:DNA-binding transcriptional ArsR family regulator
MAKKTRLTELAQIFRVLSDETRLQIVMELQQGELNVSTIVKKLRIPQPTVSHHLGLMRMAGLVNTRRDGKTIYYSLEEKSIASPASLRRILGDDSGLKIGNLVFGLTQK